MRVAVSDAALSVASASLAAREVSSTMASGWENGLPVAPGKDQQQAVRAEFDFPPSAKIIGMVARLALQKDHVTLVRAAERVVAEYPDVRFLLLGGCGPEKQELAHGEVVKAAIANSSAAASVVYAGFRSDVAHYAKCFDISVLCTHFEGLPLVVLEAMALGKPVVATRVGGIPEAVLEGETGLRPARGRRRCGACRTSAPSARRDENLARAMGDAGRERVRTAFSPDNTTQGILQVYRTVLGHTND